MTVALLLALGLAAAAPRDTLAAVGGEVRSEVSEAPLAGVEVELLGPGSRRVTSSDGEGRYRFRGVAAGRARLRAQRLDHEPLELEVQVPPTGEVVLDLYLRPRPVPLANLVVDGRDEGRAQDTLAAPPPAAELAGARALDATPGLAEMGAGDGPGAPPGTAPADPSEVLYVRGASAELKLVLLDGAPVSTPFHLAGLLDPFQADLLRSATLFLGGAPARYDGALSYVLDLRTRPGRPGRVRSSGAVDGMATRAVVEGPVGERVRYLVGGRAIHGLGVAPLLGGSLPYGYGEGLARVDAKVGSGAVSVTGFANHEQIRLDEADTEGEEIGAEWGNTAVSLRYRGPLGGADAELTAALSAFEAGLADVADPSLPTLGATNRARLAADFTRRAGAVRLGYGGSWDRVAVRYAEPFRRPPIAPEAERRSAADAAGVYLEGSWQPARRIRLRGGVRADRFAADPAPRLAPRAAVTWLVNERTSLIAAAGRYHQYVRILDEARTDDGVDSAAYAVPSGLAVGRASHFNVALQQELEEGVRLGVEGFFKSYAEVAAPSADGAYASGVDLWVRRETGRIQGWLGYSLSWVWSLPDEGDAARFAGRQLLNAGATGSLGRWVDVEMRFAYGDGLPFAGIPVDPGTPETSGEFATLAQNATHRSAEAPPLTIPAIEPYLRLDLGISRTFAPRWAGVPMRISPYLKVLNALDRRDGLFYRPGRGEEHRPEALAGLPLLPVFGVEWTF